MTYRGYLDSNVGQGRRKHTCHSKGLQWTQTQRGNGEAGWGSQDVKGDGAEAFETTVEKRRKGRA